MRLYPESAGAINNGFLSNSLKLRFRITGMEFVRVFLSISRKLIASILKIIADLFYSVPKRHFYQSFSKVSELYQENRTELRAFRIDKSPKQSVKLGLLRDRN